MWTRLYWQKTGERMIRAGAASAMSMMTGNAVNIVDLDWGQIAGVSAGAAVFSLLTSLVATRVGDPDSPSLLPPPK